MKIVCKNLIASLLSQRAKSHIEDKSLKPAAVLVPIYEKDGEDCVLFLKRTELVEHHKGQIAFPGGAMDSTDASLKETALREAHEEAGIRPEDVEILGEMDDIRTATSFYRVTPFVGIIPYPYPFCLNRYEADELIEVPFSVFLNNANFEQSPYYNKPESFLVNYRHHLIWGATAGIMKNLSDLIRGSGLVCDKNHRR